MRILDRTGWARVAADTGLGLASAAALAGTAVAIAVTWGGAYWVFDCVAGAVVCGLALLRRRHRAGAVAAGLVVTALAILVARVARLPSEPGPAMVLGLATLVASAVRALPARWAGAVAVAGFAVVVGTLVAAPSAATGPPAATVISGLGWLVAVAVGLSLRLIDARHRAVTETVRRDERLQLARELHDVAAHHITGIVLQAQAARLVAHRRPEKLDETLEAIEAAGTDALAAMRRVVGLLREADDVASARPGPERLGELVRRFAGHGPVVRLHLPPDGADWPPEVTGTVYRVVQESLTNVSRHAPQAATATVTVVRDRRTVTVAVVDDAATAPARYPQRGGYGLVGMRERVEALGGTFHAGPRPGGGWSVSATLPVPASVSR